MFTVHGNMRPIDGPLTSQGKNDHDAYLQTPLLPGCQPVVVEAITVHVPPAPTGPVEVGRRRWRRLDISATANPPFLA
jgi:hypothetical protein